MNKAAFSFLFLLGRGHCCYATPHSKVLNYIIRLAVHNLIKVAKGSLVLVCAAAALAVAIVFAAACWTLIVFVALCWHCY